MTAADEFGRWVRRGLGRAALWLEEHDDAPVRAVLLHAVTHETSYDVQMSGSHARYASELVLRTSDPAVYRDAVWRALTESTEDEWEDQDEWDDRFLICLAGCFVEDGDERFRDLLYEHVARGDDRWETLVDEIAALDGLPGLVRVARSRPRDLRYDVGWACLPSVLADRHGTDEGHIAVARAIAAVCDACPELAEMLTPEESDGNSPERIELDGSESYAEVRPMLSDPDAGLGFANLGCWGRAAPVVEKEKAFWDLVARDEEEELPILRGLYLIGARQPFEWPFPVDLERIVAWASREPAAFELRDRISEAAAQVIENTRDPRVRCLALEWLERGHRVEAATGCLATNWEDGDWPRIRGGLDVARDDHQFHVITLDVLRVAADHPGPEAVAALLELYERGRCGFCREQVVTTLFDHGAVPEWMVGECRHEANSEVREWAETFRAGGHQGDIGLRPSR